MRSIKRVYSSCGDAVIIVAGHGITSKASYSYNSRSGPKVQFIKNTAKFKRSRSLLYALTLTCIFSYASLNRASYLSALSIVLSGSIDASFISIPLILNSLLRSFAISKVT